MELLALYFQIRDDLINLASEDYFKEKGFCEDLVEGKYSYPIIHCLNTPSKDIVRNVLKRRTTDREVLAYARSMMLKEGSFRFTYNRCDELKASIVSEIDKLGGHPGLVGLVDLLHKQVQKGESCVISEGASVRLFQSFSCSPLAAVGEEVMNKPVLERIDST